MYLFNEINNLTLFLIDWNCLIYECLHLYLVVDLIQLKTILGF